MMKLPQRQVAVARRITRAVLGLTIGVSLASAQGAPPAAASADAKQSKGPDSPLFHGESAIEMTLTFNIKELKKDKGDESPWHAATIAYADAKAPEGKHVAPVRVRTRGLWRLKNCDMPPIRLNFANKEVKGTVFHDLDEPKLVGLCKNNDTYEQYLLQEMQLYRIYRLVTPVSHKVRLLRLTYVDSASGKVEATRYAFISEDPAMLAERLGGKILKAKGATPDDLDPATSAISYVFQYMIGNSDYSYSGLHNTEIVAQPNGVNLPVAYDFDFSGAVNASYATVDPSLPIKRVRERLYRGFCQQNADLANAIPVFLQQKDAIYALYADSVGALLSPKIVKETLEYFDEFYATISDPKIVERRLLRDCRKYP